MRACIDKRSAYLSTDFGESFARRYFGDGIERLGRFTKGKRKGRLRGQVSWRKVTSGGWTHPWGAACGHVERRVGKVISVTLETAPWDGPSKTLAAWEPESGAIWY